MRAPDIAIVRKERLGSFRPKGFFDGPPDLAVEVLSPANVYPAVQEEVDQWLAAGTQGVWVVDPEHRCVWLHTPGAPHCLEAADTLSGEPVLPGLAVRVADLFPRQP